MVPSVLHFMTSDLFKSNMISLATRAGNRPIRVASFTYNLYLFDISPDNSSVWLDFSCSIWTSYNIISGLHKQLLLHSRWPFSSPMDCNFMFRCRSYFPMSNRNLEGVLKLNSHFDMDLSWWRVSNYMLRTSAGSLIAKRAFTYDVRCFGGIFDIPTYPNQMLYYISIFSKIKFSWTYLPKNLTSYWMLPDTPVVSQEMSV